MQLNNGRDVAKRRKSATKSGPGRIHADGLKKPSKRPESRGAPGAYGRGLTNLFTRQQRDRLEARRKVA